MKKKLYPIFALLCAASLTSCTLINFYSDSDDWSSGGDSDTSMQDSSGESESPLEKAIDFVELFDRNDFYYTGDLYHTVCNLAVRVVFNDGTYEFVELGHDHSRVDFDYMHLELPGIKEGGAMETFYYPGTYNVTAEINFETSEGFAYATPEGEHEYYQVEVKTSLGYRELTGLLFSQNLDETFSAGDIIIQNLNILIRLTFDKNGSSIYEYYTLTTASFTDGFEIILRLGDDELDIFNYELLAGTSYTLILKNGDIQTSRSFRTPEGYYRLNADDLALLSRDFNNNYAPAQGQVSILVIPITLSGDYVNSWTTSKRNNLNEYYFGSGNLSLKSYYERASFSQMTVSGFVTEPYVENSPTLTSNYIQEDTSYSKLFTLIENAVTYIEENHPEIDFSEYDLNDDGCLDNVHLITNFNTKDYQDGTGNNPWNTPLWPHMYQTGNHGTLSNPAANVYSISAMNKVENAITSIHEQGHIFGLQDYYDYDYKYDYVGLADMQDGNCFDWNSFSKLSVGWISPLVVRDECTINLKSASKTGDCIIIPADESTFNKSAFDEYFLLEFFTDDGNNQYFTEAYRNGCVNTYGAPASKVDFSNPDNYGVRLYHVDARAFKWNGYGFVESADKNENLYIPTDNNSFEYDDRSSYFSGFADYKLLCLIQAGGNDTFGTLDARQYLNVSDLFREGDEFTFDEYAHFLSKSQITPLTMDNGETFPYRMTFSDMTRDSITVNIERI